MRVIIPMAGRGTRLRPHTLNLPKPLMKMAGKTMIEWIIDEIKYSTNDPIEEIHFIIGDFGKEVEELLKDTAKKIGSKGYIHYQYEALGTGHALFCAREVLEGPVFVVFADTIFKGRIDIDKSVDGIIWTMSVSEPEKYGVVKTDENKIITDFVEKPKDAISNDAIVGLYYFKEAADLREEIDYIVNNDLRENNEYQLTNCLESLKEKGNRLKCASLEEWLDCGNKKELLNTQKRLLEIEYSDKKYFIDATSEIKDSSIGEGVSIESNVQIINSTLKNCIIYSNAIIKNSIISNSIIGHNTVVNKLKGSAFLGDYSEYEGI